MPAAENRARVARWVEAAWNNGDLSMVQDWYAPDYVYHDPASPTEVRGHDGIRALVSMYRTALPDIHFTIEEMVAEGDRVVWRWSATGTQRGPLLGIPASGARGTTSGIVISRFADGLWAEDYHNWDTLGLLRQIGAIPPAAQPVG